MKKNLLLLLLIILPLAAGADTVEIDGIYYNLEPTAKTAEVTSNPNQYTGDVVIPETVTYDGMEYNVSTIGDDAFLNCNGLTFVVIPNSVTSINRCAFTGCSSLTFVIIPNSVTSIGYKAFGGCSSLTSVTIPSSVTSIGNWAFAGCSSLTSVTIPNSVTSIGSFVFAECSSLTSVTIPDSVTSIDMGAFNGCSGLTSVIIGNSVTSIGWFAFRYCSSLTSVTIPNSVTSIDRNAFQGCSGLTSVIIGSGVQTISSDVFANCQQLAEVYCHAEKVPSTNVDAFEGSHIENAMLYVPAASVSAYEAVEPWKNFWDIVALDGSTPETQKCATPTISYENSRLTFDCETDDVEFVYYVVPAPRVSGKGNDVEIHPVINVSVYATKAGYEDSEVATMKISFESGGLKGDVNGDGEVGIGDIISITNIMAE